MPTRNSSTLSFMTLALTGLLVISPMNSARAADPVETAANPYIEKMKAQAKDLAGKLTLEQSEDLGKLRVAFGMVKSVDLVHEHVGDAVKACNEMHPEIGPSVSSKYTEWTDRVLPVAEYKQDVLDKAVDDGRFSNPEEIHNFLNLIDQAAQYTNSRLIRKPVITEQTCEGLRASMTNTKEELVALLNDIDWPAGIDATMPEPPPIEKAAATIEESVSQTAETVEDTAETLNSEAADTLDEVTDEATQTVDEVMDDAAEASEDAMKETEESLEDATEAATGVMDAVEEEANDAATDVIDAVEDTADEVGEATTQTIPGEEVISEEELEKAFESLQNSEAQRQEQMEKAYEGSETTDAETPSAE